MPINLRGKRWVVSIGSGAERIRESFDTEAEAKQFELNETMKKLGAAHKSPTTVDTTMGMLYMLTCKMRWSECQSSEKLKLNGRLVKDYLGADLPVSQVTPEKIRNMQLHFAELGNAGSTINRKISSLSVMLTLAEDEGWIQAIPKLKRRRESEHRIRFMTSEEETKALTFCEVNGLTDLSDFIQCAIDTGFRRGELLRLKVSDSEGHAAILHAGAGSTKSQRARAVPLTSRVRAIIAKRKLMGNSLVFEGFSVSKLRRAWDMLVDYMRMAEDKQFVVHMLRHTCASRLAQAGKNAPFIMNWMGHSSIMVTQRYMHLSPRTMDEGIEALEGFQKAA